MPANVETMMYVREKPWHGSGTMVEEAPTSADALHIAGLDWRVEGKPVYTESGIQIPGYVANTRDSDGRILGIVSDKYKIVQNVDAFQFTDNLINDEVHYETAGSLRNGKTIFLLAQLPKTSILGDEFEQYLCFTSTHDGTGAVRVCSTNVRVVCQNTLNLALSTAKRSWTCKHMGNIQDKLSEAQHALGLAIKYNEELSKYAERAANITIDREKTMEAIQRLFPISKDASDRAKKNNAESIQDFNNCLVSVDLSPFYGTLWGLVNAASDFVYHRAPVRQTKTFNETRMSQAIGGSKLLDTITEMFPVNMN